MSPVTTNQRGWFARADRLGGLQRVIDLREVGVRIAVVDERRSRYSSASQTLIVRRLSARYSRFFACTKSSVWCAWFWR